MEKVRFQNRDGLNLAGILQKNVDSPSKYIVMVHGFTGNKDEKGLFVEASEYFTSKGFAVFRFDMRGSGESEGDFSTVTINDEKDDLFSALSYLKQSEKIGDKKIYLVGFSLGATVGLLGYPEFEKYRAMALWSPAFFPERDMYPRYQTSEILNSLSTKGYFEKSGLKVGSKIVENLRDCNLIPYLQKVDSPTLVIHGKKDDKISYQSSEIAAKLLNGNGTLEVLPDGCHSFRGSNGVREQVFEKTSAFFNWAHQ